ncbi:rRNA maturation RNase YbeY [Candidatus Kaiserbacteria bacterium CG10_big_fil_rev_8_21_14_0_10_56_12]|uniref:Endoribonuclease YbeY n=1 Tax=Candidatus Kaiserbacteria bacterium CG10_big_fil_rev_8_21_14_0_10_56_12 TaxID=1974611 RepID=A0A2H0UA99_9BACT|nr:MAG: rRNA maturation RNase YbeY [Candidatus Kaiserbacteria bacterium CG10_big_fil_rev_8_21_14_0_10_56_12]
MAAVSIRNFTRGTRVPRLPYDRVAERVLPAWEISLVFAGNVRARSLNVRLRGKSYTPNVLSYALDKQSGEIIICLPEARRQAPAYGMSESNFILYLFIHGLLHLAGRPHGATMERWEQRLLAEFAVSSSRTSHGATHRNRNRHRHLPGQAGRR